MPENQDGNAEVFEFKKSLPKHIYITVFKFQILIEINKYRNYQINYCDLIKTVCNYFDKIKTENISQGVPSNIVEYYENPEGSERIKVKFDNYEQEIFNKINKIINNND